MYHPFQKPKLYEITLLDSKSFKCVTCYTVIDRGLTHILVSEKKLQKHLPTLNLPAVRQKQIFQNKNAKKMFSRPTDSGFSGYVIGNKDLF